MHPLRTVRKRPSLPAGFKTPQNLARIFRFTGGIKMTMRFLVEIDIGHDAIEETTAKVTCDYEDEGKEKIRMPLKDYDIVSIERIS